MPLVSRCLTNLVMGLSEQPTVLRQPSQAELVENCRQTAFGACDKRFGSLYFPAQNINDVTVGIGATTGWTQDNAFFPIKLSDGTEYVAAICPVQFGTGGIFIWDLNGNAQTIVAPHGYTYLSPSSSGPGISTGGAKPIKWVQAGDTVFVLNQNKTPTLTGTTAPSAVPQALVWVKNANPPGSPGCTYTITLDGVTATVSDASYNQALPWGTTDVAASLAANLITALGGSAANYSIAASESYVVISRVNLADFTLTVSDTKGNDWTKLIKGNTQQISDLPTKCINGFQVTITGAVGAPATAWYYVTFATTDPTPPGNFGRGKWVESSAPGVLTTIAADTVPWTITKTGTSTFTFDYTNWGQRLVGDTTTAPTPYFIGNPITDIFFYRDRLGLISGGNRVSLSMSGLYRQFFPLTVLAGLTDDDPISVAVDVMDSTNIFHVTPTDTGCILWGDRSQFQLTASGGGLLTPKTVSCAHLASFECHPAVKPVALGNNFYFMTPPETNLNAVNRGTAQMRLMEFYYDWQSQNHDAEDVTAHCPTLMRSFIPRMVACPRYNHLIQWDASPTSGGVMFKNDLTKNGLPTLKVYSFFDQGEQRIQSAWSHWYFDEGLINPPNTNTPGNPLLAGFYHNGFFYMLQRCPSGPGIGVYTITKVAISTESFDDQVVSGNANWGIPQQTRLDRMIDTHSATVTRSYNGGTNQTTFTLPYYSAATMRVVECDINNFPVTLQEVPCTNTLGTNTVVVTGDYTTVKCWVGQQFTMKYQPSQQYVKDYRGALDTSGRIQYLRWRVTYEGTGYLAYSVQAGSRTANTGIIVNGDITLPSGQADFPVLCRSTEAVIQLTSNHWLPCRINSLEWWANYFTPYQRIL